MKNDLGMAEEFYLPDYKPEKQIKFKSKLTGEIREEYHSLFTLSKPIKEGNIIVRSLKIYRPDGYVEEFEEVEEA